MVSPFEFQRPLQPSDLAGRDSEVDQVARSAAEGRALTVVAPRRYGKTSVLLAAGERLHDLGHTVVHVDLYAVASLGELVLRLERGWARTRSAARKAVQRVLDAADVGVSLSGPGFSATLARRPATDPLPALHALLALPERVGRRDGRVVLVLDEFQSVGAIRGAEGVLRSYAQHHHGVASYLFAGSEPALVDAAFDQPDRPFYGQALRLRLERPARGALATAVERGFAATGKDAGEALGPLLDLADRHPQRTMLLAHLLWEATPDSGTADLVRWGDALDAARGQVDGEVQALYDRASPNQRKLLRLLAARRAPYEGAGLRLVAMDSGSVAKTLAQLDRDGFVERVDGGGHRIIDPLLGDWIRRRLPV